MVRLQQTVLRFFWSFGIIHTAYDLQLNFTKPKLSSSAEVRCLNQEKARNSFRFNNTRWRRLPSQTRKCAVCAATAWPSPPSRTHSGQHPPAGVKGLWWAGQVRGGHGRARHDTAPREQTQSVHGDGLHWLSCCTGARDERKRKRKHCYREREREREHWGTSVCLILSDRWERTVAPGRSGRSYNQSRNTTRRLDGGGGCGHKYRLHEF